MPRRWPAHRGMHELPEYLAKELWEGGRLGRQVLIREGVSGILSKLDVADRTRAAVLALRLGLVSE